MLAEIQSYRQMLPPHKVRELLEHTKSFVTSASREASTALLQCQHSVAVRSKSKARAMRGSLTMGAERVRETLCRTTVIPRHFFGEDGRSLDARQGRGGGGSASPLWSFRVHYWFPEAPVAPTWPSRRPPAQTPHICQSFFRVCFRVEDSPELVLEFGSEFLLSAHLAESFFRVFFGIWVMGGTRC